MKYRWLKAFADIDRPLLVLISFFSVWSIWFIYRTSFTIDAIRYFCLIDDAMISMAYAKNFVDGYGLNWARFGEPVEGFTTPLWTFLMIPVNALPIGLNYKSLFVQILSMILLILNVLMIRRLMVSHFSFGPKKYWFPAAVLTAFYYPLNYWALRGMESGLQVLLVTLSVYYALNIIEKKSSPVTLCLLFAVAYLVRMDMILFVLVVLGFIVYQHGFNRADKRLWLIGFTIFGTTIVSYSIFRWIYFHELLPNTYYLKLTGVPFEIRVLRGLYSFVEHFFLSVSLPILLVVAGIVPFVRTRPKLVLPLLIVAIYFSYSIYVGGDAIEHARVGANRFVIVAMPMFFVLFNALLNQGLSYFEQRKGQSSRRDRYVMFFVSLICFLSVNGFLVSEYSLEEEVKRFTVIWRPLIVNDHAMVVHNSIKLKVALEPASIVVTDWAGAPAYFTDFRMVDCLGYNDKTIARMDIPPLSTADFKEYIPGHLKTDIHYILTKYKPDFLFRDVLNHSFKHEVEFSHKDTVIDNFFQSLRNQGYEYRNELDGWHKSAVSSET